MRLDFEIDCWQNAFVVFSARSWEPIYGIDVLLEAFRKSSAQNPRLRLILLDEGSLSTSIERFISECGLNDFVYRPGVISQERLPDYFRAADLYVSCSLSDGSSVSLLEAMATGLPVVVTDAPGNREWVVTSENGWLAAPGDADAFKRAMLDAAEMSHSGRERMAIANRRLIEQRADWNVNFGKLLRLTIISKRGSGGKSASDFVGGMESTDDGRVERDARNERRNANDRRVPSPSSNRICRFPASGFRMALLHDSFTV